LHPRTAHVVGHFQVHQSEKGEAQDASELGGQPHVDMWAQSRCASRKKLDHPDSRLQFGDWGSPVRLDRLKAMSNAAALGLIIATLFTTNILAFWTLDRCTTRVGQVINGVHDGIPISTDFRRLMVFQNVLPAMANIAFVDVLGAFVMMGAAQSVSPDAGIQWIAYAASLWNVVAAVQWLVGGGILVLYLTSVIRGAKDN
jgi:hypothetical protein